MAEETVNSVNAEDGDNSLDAVALIPTEEPPKGVSTTLTLINFLKGMIGAGCLALPVAFKNCGLWAGLVTIFAVGCLNFFCMRQLVLAAQYLCAKEMGLRSGKEELDYGHLAKKAFDYGPARLQPHSRIPLYCTNVVICAFQLGIGSVFIVFMASHLKEVLSAFDSMVVVKTMDTRIFMAIVLLPVILINFIRELRVLGWLSTIGNVCMLFAFFVIFGYLVTAIITQGCPVGHLPAVKGFGTYVVGVGSMLYAFEGQALVLPMENKMENPKYMLGATGVLPCSMAIITSLYAATGMFGYATYGNAVKGSIAENLDNSPLSLTVKIAVVISVYIGYGIQLYIIIEMLWPAIMRKLPERLVNYGLLLEYLFRVALVLVTFAFAVAIPNLEHIIPLVGVTAGMILAFIIPPILDAVTFWEAWLEGPRWRLGLLLVRNSALAALGLFGLVAGVYVNIRRIADSL